MGTIAFGRESFYPKFRPTYEIVRVEQDKIFIIPHVWNNEEPDARYDKKYLVDDLIATYVFHICTAFDKSICDVRNRVYKLVFGFRKETSFDWKLVEYKFSHVGKGGGCICPAVYLYNFKNYEGDVPEESEVTGFPSSSLLDDEAYLKKYTC